MALIIATCVYLEGSAKKRFGIDGDREAVPLTLELLYNKVRLVPSMFVPYRNKCNIQHNI